MKLYQDKEWLYDHYVIKKMNSREIAKIVDVCPSTVSRWLRKLGIPIRDISACQQPNKNLELLQSKEWLTEEYIDKKRSIKSIARELNVSDSTVRAWLDKHSIRRKNYTSLIKEQNSKMLCLDSKQWLHDMYISKSMSANQIANMLDVSYGTVKRRLDTHGIKGRNIKESKNCNSKIIIQTEDDKEIIDLYVQGMNIVKIGEKLGYSHHVIYERLKYNNIPILTYIDRALIRNPLLKKLRDKNWLYKQYITKNYSIVDIGESLNTNSGTVYHWLKKHNIEIKDSSFSHSKEKYSDEDLETMLKNLADKIGHIPSTRELNEYCSQGLCPSAATYSLRGGIPYWQKRVFGKRNRAWLEWQKRCLSVFNKVLGYPKFKAEKSFDWLRSPMTGHRLKVDVYYPKLKLVVEFDGIGHFEPVQFLKGQNAEKQFKKTQIHDAEKNKKIPENGLKLLRFRYDEPLNKKHVRGLLKEKLGQAVFK